MDLDSDATAAIVGALGGAIVGALIAAGFAYRQLSRQLGHDRALADLAELRGVLDEAAALAAEALRRTNRIFIILTPDQAEQNDLGVLVAPDLEHDEVADEIAHLRTMLEEERKAQAEFLAGPPAVLMMLQRIMLRLGRDDSITQAFTDVYEALGNFLEALPEPGVRLEPAKAAGLTTARQAVSDAQFEFIDTARERVGAVTSE